jgi:1-deoxy-D-xylulose 5-phosphate reductoisomerase
LLDRCPARYRDHDVLRRRPQVLAWLAERHVAAEAAAVAAAIAAARADLADAVGARGVEEVLAALEREAALLLADRRAAGLVAEALSRAGGGVP